MLIDFLNNLLILMNSIGDIQLDVINLFLVIFAGLSAVIAILSFYFSRKDLKEERKINNKNNIFNLKYGDMNDALYTLENFLFRYYTISSALKTIKNGNIGSKNVIDYNTYLIGKFLTLKSYKIYTIFLPKIFKEKIDELYIELKEKVNKSSRFRGYDYYGFIIEFDKDNFQIQGNDSTYHIIKPILPFYIKDLNYFKELAEDSKIFSKNFDLWCSSLNDVSEIENLFDYLNNCLNENINDRLIMKDIENF